MLECYVDENLFLISQVEICPKAECEAPKVQLYRCIEDWEFKVWQWLNFWLPWWPFQYLSAANLLKSFYSPLPLHKVPLQLELDYLSLSLVRQGPASLAHTHIHTHTHSKPSESNQTNQSLPIAPYPLPLPDKKRQPLPLSKLPLHSRFSNLDYLPSLFHKTGHSHRSSQLPKSPLFKRFSRSDFEQIGNYRIYHFLVVV